MDTVKIGFGTVTRFQQEKTGYHHNEIWTMDTNQKHLATGNEQGELYIWNLEDVLTPAAREILMRYRKKMANAKKRWKRSHSPEVRAVLTEETTVLLGNLEKILDEVI